MRERLLFKNFSALRISNDYSNECGQSHLHRGFIQTLQLLLNHFFFAILVQVNVCSANAPLDRFSFFLLLSFNFFCFFPFLRKYLLLIKHPFEILVRLFFQGQSLSKHCWQQMCTTELIESVLYFCGVSFVLALRGEYALAYEAELCSVILPTSAILSPHFGSAIILFCTEFTA